MFVCDVCARNTVHIRTIHPCMSCTTYIHYMNHTRHTYTAYIHALHTSHALRKSYITHMHASAQYIHDTHMCKHAPQYSCTYMHALPILHYITIHHITPHRMSIRKCITLHRFITDGHTCVTYICYMHALHL